MTSEARDTIWSACERMPCTKVSVFESFKRIRVDREIRFENARCGRGCFQIRRKVSGYVWMGRQPICALLENYIASNLSSLSRNRNSLNSPRTVRKQILFILLSEAE